MRVVLNGLPMAGISRSYKTFIVLSAIIAAFISFSCSNLGKETGHFSKVEAAPSWPHDFSDIEPDPNIKFGRLNNGFRYVIQRNQTPSDRVSMHLFVKVGSLYERDEEQGIAHFLEHMLFNGSTHFPPGEMVKYFQRIGMQFGPDANAHTGFDRTVYDVLLPRGDEKSLSEGLIVLKDYASGALLLPEEVVKEKKVILAEMRDRDSAHFRTVKASFQFETPGMTIGHRFPIGEAETVKKMDHRMLRDFYEAWYRPERMFLVVVGDLQIASADRLIKGWFSDIEAKRPPRPLPVTGRMRHEGIKVFHHYEKDAGAATVAIETITQRSEPPDSKAYRLDKMKLRLACMMMKKRLEKKIRSRDTVLTSANIGAGYYLKQINYAEIRGRTSPEHWREAVAELEQVSREARLHGFTPNELMRAKKQYKAKIQKAVQGEGTRDSKVLARQIMASISDWHVLQSPGQKAQWLLKELDTIKLSEINKAFSQAWSAKHRLVLVTGNAQLSDSTFKPEDLILSAYTASSKIEVKPPVRQKLAKFPYLPMPKSKGVILHREEFKDLGITKVQFKNGIHLFLKKTPFKENQVVASLSFGHGKFSEPKDQPCLADITKAVVNESGFGGMDRTELENALAGRMANIELDIREDLFVVKGMAVQKELPLLFQLLYTFVQDPGCREEARQLVIDNFEQEHKELSKRVLGIMKLKGHRFLAGGDQRFGTANYEDLQQRTAGQIKAWMGKQLHNTPMELALVGDFDVDQVIKLASQYIGALPGRGSTSPPKGGSGPDFPTGKTIKLSVQTQIPKALVVVAYPTEDFWDINRTRRLSIMAQLLDERLRQHIRENLGAAYSPHAYNHSYRAYQGYGLTKIFIQVDPDQADFIVDEVRRIADRLSISNDDADEFRRILDPTLTHIKDLRQKNTYWLNSVLTGAARYPQQLDWARSFEADYAAIKSDEVQSLARKYLSNEKAAVIIIVPAKP